MSLFGLSCLMVLALATVQRACVLTLLVAAASVACGATVAATTHIALWSAFQLQFFGSTFARTGRMSLGHTLAGFSLSSVSLAVEAAPSEVVFARSSDFCITHCA